MFLLDASSLHSLFGPSSSFPHAAIRSGTQTTSKLQDRPTNTQSLTESFRTNTSRSDILGLLIHSAIRSGDFIEGIPVRGTRNKRKNIIECYLESEIHSYALTTNHCLGDRACHSETLGSKLNCSPARMLSVILDREEVRLI